MKKSGKRNQTIRPKVKTVNVYVTNAKNKSKPGEDTCNAKKIPRRQTDNDYCKGGTIEHTQQ